MKQQQDETTTLAQQIDNDFKTKEGEGTKVRYQMFENEA
jgi:hypothetical protein